jgi:hypothetical protein
MVKGRLRKTQNPPGFVLMGVRSSPPAPDFQGTVQYLKTHDASIFKVLAAGNLMGWFYFFTLSPAGIIIVIPLALRFCFA